MRIRVSWPASSWSLRHCSASSSVSNGSFDQRTENDDGRPWISIHVSLVSRFFVDLHGRPWTYWRKAWDSNPRKPEDFNGFRGRPIRPLWQPSSIEASEKSAIPRLAQAHGDRSRRIGP